jgi:threonine/homoserine/homoserine lactone efflux protein
VVTDPSTLALFVLASLALAVVPGPASATAFTIVKHAGAAYLIGLGIRRLLTRERSYQDIVRSPRALRRIFVDGVIALCSDSMWALAAGTLGAWLRRSRRYLGVKRWLTGTVFVGLGVSTVET